MEQTCPRRHVSCHQEFTYKIKCERSVDIINPKVKVCLE